MLNDVVEVRPMGGYVVYLRFDDGAEGEIDLGKLFAFKGVFEPLKEQARFEEVFVNKELGTICWPSGADLDPCVPYSEVTGAPLPGEHRYPGLAYSWNRGLCRRGVFSEYESLSAIDRPGC